MPVREAFERDIGNDHQSDRAGSGGAEAADQRDRRRRRRRQRHRQHDRADVQGVDFVVANTDAQALNASRRRPPHPARPQITQGLGAGSRPEIGRAAAEETLDEIDRAARRRAHVLHRRRHGRRHRHRRRAGHRQGRPRQGHPDRRRRHQAVRLRRRAPRPLGRAGIDRAAAARRHADRHPQPEPVPPRQREDDLQGSVRDGRRGAPAGRRAGSPT